MTSDKWQVISHKLKVFGGNLFVCRCECSRKKVIILKLRGQKVKKFKNQDVKKS